MTVPTITPLATASPSRGTRSTFAGLMDSLLAWMNATFVPQINAAVAAFNIDLASFNSTVSTVTPAAVSATNAANVNGTSATNATPVNGSAITFTYAEANRIPFLGQRVRAVSRANPTTNFHDGVCSAANGNQTAGLGTIQITSDNACPTPLAASDWNIVMSGVPGVGSTLLTAKVTIGASGSLVKANAGAAVETTVASTITLDKAALLGNGWSAFVPQAGTSYDITLNTSNSESLAVVKGIASASKRIPKNVPAVISTDGTAHKLTRLYPVSESELFTPPTTASVINSQASNGTAVDVCALAPTRGFMVYKAGAAQTNISLIDNTGAVLGSSVLVAETVNLVRMVPIDANRALVVYQGNTTGATKQVIVSYTGTAVTVGAVLSSGASSVTDLAVCILPGTSKAIMAWCATSSCAATVLTIGAGTTLTATNGTNYTIGSGSNCKIVGINGTTALIAPGSGTSYFFASEAAGVLTVGSNVFWPFNTNTLEFSLLATGRVLVAGGISGQALNFGLVLDYLGLSLSPNVGNLTPIGGIATTTNGVPAQKLLQVTPDCLVRVGNIGSGTWLAASSLTVRDNGVIADCGSVPICTNTVFTSGSWGAALFGNTVVVIYVDANNSNFPTTRTVTVG